VKNVKAGYEAKLEGLLSIIDTVEQEKAVCFAVYACKRDVGSTSICALYSMTPGIARGAEAGEDCIGAGEVYNQPTEGRFPCPQHEPFQLTNVPTHLYRRLVRERKFERQRPDRYHMQTLFASSMYR
jgi:hypothetical protein